MEKELMAELLAKHCFAPQKVDSLGFAIQLFIEQAVLPVEINGYTESEIKAYIIDYLRKEL
jgi:hypothetical protein